MWSEVSLGKGETGGNCQGQMKRDLWASLVELEPNLQGDGKVLELEA